MSTEQAIIEAHQRVTAANAARAERDDLIRQGLAGGISAYRISKITGLAQSAISKIKGAEMTLSQQTSADGVNLLNEPPSPLYTTWSDAVQREVLEPLGADSADFDIDAIAGETIAEYTHRSDSGAVRQGCYSAVSTEEFWAIAAKHDVASAAVEKVNAYNGDNIWQDVILRLNGYDEDATSDIDPGGRSDAFVVARRVIRHDQARGEWFSAETI